MSTNPDHLVMLGALASTLQRGGVQAVVVPGTRTIDSGPEFDDTIVIYVQVENERRRYVLSVDGWTPGPGQPPPRRGSATSRPCPTPVGCWLETR